MLFIYNHLANILTFTRIALIPVIMMAFYTNNVVGHWVAAITFLVACATDYLDGYFARRLHQTTKLGQFFDPIADKLLICSTLFFLVGFGYVHEYSYIPAVIILCREILISGLREFLGSLQVKMVVTQLAKWKTACQMTAIALLVISPDSFHGSHIWRFVGEILLWVSAFLTLISGFNYFYAALKYFPNSVSSQPINTKTK